MPAMIDPLEVAKSYEDAGLANVQGEDLVTRDYFKGEIVALKNDIVCWMLGSQVMPSWCLLPWLNSRRCWPPIPKVS
ncbi:hypothetical protein [Sphingomonas sp. PAMC 26621]|uniref:hypothetical protein n=1 Tax=Sphingomonas sp. PAMC 26621 TaxID=1112213 RepID=UPI0011115E19|nr:hypothetical protein [Sphingomonas sp. PAMC 26621]